MRITDERRQREVQRICEQSTEIKELQNKINAAYLNKERGSQITEQQYRKQIEIVSSFSKQWYYLFLAALKLWKTENL